MGTPSLEGRCKLCVLGIPSVRWCARRPNPSEQLPLIDADGEVTIQAFVR